MSDNSAGLKKIREIDEEIAAYFAKTAKIRRKEIDAHTTARQIQKVALQKKLQELLTAEELDLL